MAEEAAPQDVSAPALSDTLPAVSEIPESKAKLPASVNGGDAAPSEPSHEVATDTVAPTSPAPACMIALLIVSLISIHPTDQNFSRLANEPESKSISDTPPQDKPVTTQEDIEMKEDIKATDGAPSNDEPTEHASGDPASTDKSKARRKSGGVPEHKKKLNKKASKAKMTHTDAQPGDYFFVRLKGYPLWPAIVCDETMLPSTLIKSRPVTAARPDGTYRADYEDGGSKVKDRTFPVMYLHTNEL